MATGRVGPPSPNLTSKFALIPILISGLGVAGISGPVGCGEPGQELRLEKIVGKKKMDKYI